MLPNGVEITVPLKAEFSEILTPEAVAFIAGLERAFRERRQQLLQQRKMRQEELNNGRLPQFPPETENIRQSDWQIAPTPPDLQKRWVEITGPTDRKMIINALNSGADVFMADFEDANSPTWVNMVEGQLNLRDAVRGTIRYTHPDKDKEYTLNEETATLLVRPRGWHLDEKHMCVDGRPVSGSLFDFGLYFFHNTQALLDNGTGPYFYLPKLENHLEARLWNDVFVMAQDQLGIPQGTIRATVLIETILAAFEMEEILYELREHSAGLNAGRWDYIFSIIKKFRQNPDCLLPDRAQITMTVPFMHAYTEKLVQSCHKRGAHAIGGMAAFIPNRRDPEVTEHALEKVRQDKTKESSAGFDGSWVAHPDLVPLAHGIFEKELDGRPHQKDRLREDVNVTAEQLTNFTIEDGQITEEGVRTNLNVALLYIESWLQGTGAAALYNLMEDTATAEISRAQLWQWINHREAKLEDGRIVNLPLCRLLMTEELQKIARLVGSERYASGRFTTATKLLDQLISEGTFTEFLTLPGYDYLA